MPVKTDQDIDTTREDSSKIFFHLHINQIIVMANSVTDKARIISFGVSEKYYENLFHLYQSYQETGQVSIG